MQPNENPNGAHTTHKGMAIMINRSYDGSAISITIHCKYSLIARFMGPTWGQSGADRIHVGPYLPRERCYLFRCFVYSDDSVKRSENMEWLHQSLSRVEHEGMFCSPYARGLIIFSWYISFMNFHPWKYEARWRFANIHFPTQGKLYKTSFIISNALSVLFGLYPIKNITYACILA